MLPGGVGGGAHLAGSLGQVAEDVSPVGVAVRDLVAPEVELLQAVQGGEIAHLGELRGGRGSGIEVGRGNTTSA